MLKDTDSSSSYMCPQYDISQNEGKRGEKGMTVTMTNKLKKWANSHFTHDPERDPVTPATVIHYILWIAGTCSLIGQIPDIWLLFVYSWIVGAIMLFFSLRSQRRHYNRKAVKEIPRYSSTVAKLWLDIKD